MLYCEIAIFTSRIPAYEHISSLSPSQPLRSVAVMSYEWEQFWMCTFCLIMYTSDSDNTGRTVQRSVTASEWPPSS